MKIVFPDPIELHQEVIEEIKKLGDLTVHTDVPKNASEIIERIKDADIITANWIDITKEIIEAAPTLKYIIVPAVGYEWIDLQTANKKNIKVINCPTHNGTAVANFAIGLMFAITRKIFAANNALKKGEWKPLQYKGDELSGKILGIIGYGNIGRQTAEIAEKLGMNVIHVRSSAAPEDIDHLIKTSDIVSLHLPLTEQSKHLLDERRLRLMKKNAYLINTARGAIIDQKALMRVLQENHLAGVALDVFENEPLNGTPNQEIIDLVHMEKVLATPHIAFNSQETWDRLGSELLANVKACVEGKPINIVN